MAVAGVPVGIRNSAGIGELPEDYENGRGTVIQGIGINSTESLAAFKAEIFNNDVMTVIEEEKKEEELDIEVNENQEEEKKDDRVS